MSVLLVCCGICGRDERLLAKLRSPPSKFLCIIRGGRPGPRPRARSGRFSGCCRQPVCHTHHGLKKRTRMIGLRVQGFTVVRLSVSGPRARPSDNISGLKKHVGPGCVGGNSNSSLSYYILLLVLRCQTRRPGERDPARPAGGRGKGRGSTVSR